MTPLLTPFAWVYASLVRARNARFDREAAQRLRWPVVSIGNLSVGGTGKTPLVICLAQLLERERFRPDVLSRGYGRSSKEIERVNSAGDAERFGDEPLLIARTAGVPVYVGPRRYEAGLLAEAELGGEGRHVHLLDDGFQHRQLARNVDIVVIHRSDLQQRLLPAGRLREPLSSLRRADVIVLRQEDAELESTLRLYARKDCRFWRVRRTLSLPVPVKRALAFCAIARPAEFFAALEAAGVEVVERKSFPDHHRFTAADIDRLAELGRRHGCDAFVTTAKDEVKLEAAVRQRLNTVAPLRIASLVLELEDEAAVLAQLSTKIVLPPTPASRGSNDSPVAS
jgi:tetraacyldisaccharide 4'-kinase